MQRIVERVASISMSSSNRSSSHKNMAVSYCVRCIYTHTHTHTHRCVNTHVSTHTCQHTHFNTRSFSHNNMALSSSVRCMYAHTQSCIHICKHTHMSRHISTHCNTLQHTATHCNTLYIYIYMEHFKTGSSSHKTMTTSFYVRCIYIYTHIHTCMYTHM